MFTRWLWRKRRTTATITATITNTRNSPKVQSISGRSLIYLGFFLSRRSPLWLATSGGLRRMNKNHTQIRLFTKCVCANKRKQSLEFIVCFRLSALCARFDEQTVFFFSCALSLETHFLCGSTKPLYVCSVHVRSPVECWIEALRLRSNRTNAEQTNLTIESQLNCILS